MTGGPTNADNQALPVFGSSPPANSYPNLPSPQSQASPLQPASQGTKERRKPSVTPRRFNRFFTPRSILYPNFNRQGRSRHALFDITRNSRNSLPAKFERDSSPPSIADDENDAPLSPTSLRKRRRIHASLSSPTRPSFSKRLRAQLSQAEDGLYSPSAALTPSPEIDNHRQANPQRINKTYARDIGTRIMQRETAPFGYRGAGLSQPANSMFLFGSYNWVRY
jgi:hypothetical protein